MERAKPNRTNSGYRALKQASAQEINLDSTGTLPMAPSDAVTPWVVYLIFIATLGPLQFGYHLGELNAPQKVITCQVEKTTGIADYATKTLPHCIPMNDFQWGMIQSIFTVGGFFGAVSSGCIATKYGRLFALRWIAFILAGGPIAEALAGKMWVLALGRAISGLGAGAATVVSPIYISEIAPASRRGLFGAFTQVQINFGILAAQFLGLFLSRDNKWRWILATCGFIAMVTFLGLMIAPETPKWLANNNRPRMARGVLQRIRGKDADIREEMEDWDMSGTAEEESLLRPGGPRPHKEPGKSVFDVIRLKKYRRAVIGVSITMMAQQLTGINSVVMYSVAILGEVMPGKAALITVIVSAANVLFTLLFSPLADRIGRKPTLLLSTTAMGTASILLAAGLSKGIQILTIIGLVIFVCGFGLGLGPVPFILASELTGPEAVGATSSWALALNWLMAFIVAQFFPALNAAMPRGQIYWVFAGVALIFSLLIAWWIPESKGKRNAEEVWARKR